MARSNLQSIPPPSKQDMFRQRIDDVAYLLEHQHPLEAEKLCKNLQKAGCRSADFYGVYARTLQILGKTDEALTTIAKALKTKPKNPNYLNTNGELLLRKENFDDAATTFDQITKILPKSPIAWANMGNAFYRARALGQAAEALEKALEIDGDDIEIVTDLGVVYKELKQFPRAIELLDKAYDLDAQKRFKILRERVRIARELEDIEYLENYVATWRKRETLEVEQAVELYNTEVDLLEFRGDLDGAINLAFQKLNLCTDQSRMYLYGKLSMLYNQIGDYSQAIECLEKALEINPNFHHARWNLSLIQLSVGDLEQGLKNYETRWNLEAFPSARRKFKPPQWGGEKLEGKKILIWGEQGIGDQIKFASMINDLEHMGAEVTIECAPKLVPVLTLGYPWAKVRSNGPVYCVGKDNYDDFDFHIPFFSLALILRPKLEDFYAKQRSWLPRQNDLEHAFRRMLSVQEDEILVGLCWRSSLQTSQRITHYLQPIDLFPLAVLPNTKFVCLQYDECTQEVETLRKIGLPIYHFGNLNQKDDLINTAGLIGACDMVISVGTAVVELAAAIGVPSVLFKQQGGEECLGTDHVPWNPTVLTVLMNAETKPYVLAEIVKDFGKLLDWAQTVSTANREVLEL